MAILFVFLRVLTVVGVNFRGIDAMYKGVILNGPGGPSRVEISDPSLTNATWAHLTMLCIRP